jgi:hypothetical protein
MTIDTTRRGFVQNLTAGAAGMTFVSALTSLSTAVLASQEAKPKIPPEAGFTKVENVEHAKNPIEFKRKYDRYFVYQAPARGPQTKRNIAYIDSESFPDSHQYNCHWVFVHPDDPNAKSWDEMGHGPHEHKVPEVIMHIGTDPENPKELGGEVEIAMGPELERYHITKSCMVYLPAGFIHSPWVIRRVDRPFIVVTVCQETGHTEKPHPELLSEEERSKMMFIYQGYGRGKDKERRIVLPKGKSWEGKQPQENK